MNSHGGLPAIHPYDIARHWHLHNIRQVRAMVRVGSIKPEQGQRLIKESQKEMCNARKDLR